jgi:hypothetical protein
MVWTKKDKVLFRILQDFGKRHLEAQIKRSTRMFLKYKTPPPSFTLFGYYDPKKQEFVWLNDMNRRMIRFIQEGYQPLFGSDTSWKKLFRSTVSLPASHQNDIPYLMEILNARYRVVRLEDKGFPVYGLVALEGVKQTFSFDEFQQAMFLYRMEDDLERKYGSRATRKRLHRVH